MPPFPANCPPSESVDPNIIVFRIAKEEPPSVRSFRTPAEMGTQRNIDECSRHTLSVTQTLEDAKHLRQLHESLGNFITSGPLDLLAGKILVDGINAETHTNWRPIEPQDQRVARFQTVLVIPCGT